MIAAVPLEATELSDDALYELVDGVLVEKPVSSLSIWIAGDLYLSLGHFVKSRKLGTFYSEMVFILDAVTNLRRRPDLAFLSAAKWPVGRPPPAKGDWAIIPDLAIEVASPGNTFSNLARKVREYFEHGVAEVWILIPEERQVYVYRSPREARVLEAADVLSTTLLPDWSATVGDVIPPISESEQPNGTE